MEIFLIDVHRNQCKIIIRISADELKEKYKDKNAKINYIITSTEKNHTCINTDKINSYIGPLNSIENIKKLASVLIKQNLNKKLSFHIDLLTKSKLPLTKRQIKYLLQNIREEEMPMDKDFYSQIAQIKIDLESNIAELKNMPFFLAKKN